MAWTNTFDTDTPPTGQTPKQGDDRIREMKAAIQERLNSDADGTADEGDMIFELDGSNEVSDMAAGEYRQITFNERAADPAPASLVDKLFLFAKNDGDNCELYAKDEQGNVFQVTIGGAMFAKAVVSAVRTRTADLTANSDDTWRTITWSAGTAYIEIVTNGGPVEIVFGAEWDLDASSGFVRLRIQRTDNVDAVQLNMANTRFSMGTDKGRRHHSQMQFLDDDAGGGLAAGTYRYRIQYKCATSTLKQEGGTYPAHFYVKEFRQ